MSPRTPRGTVLLLTHSGDFFTVERVAEALARRGARAFRLDTDLFPEELRISSGLGNRGTDYTVEAGGESLRASEVRAVWARKLWMPRRDERLDERLRAMCARESVAALEGFLDGLHGAHWVNRPAREREAENKLLQLRVAAEVDLRVPRTLFTNDPAAVRDFARTCEGGMITKMLSSFAVYDERGREQVVFTNRVRAEDLADLEGLRLCPMTFQESVPKSLELRATVVGGRVFTASIDSGAKARAADDWRREGAALVEEWRHYRLPPDTEARLLRLADEFGLNYGAADFILTPDGRHVFLEINPAGEFFWLEQQPGLPISAALADVLLGLAPRR